MITEALWIGSGQWRRAGGSPVQSTSGKVMWKLMGTLPAEGVESTVMWFTTSTRMYRDSSDRNSSRQMALLASVTASGGVTR